MDIIHNISRVRAAVTEACERAARPAQSVTLIAVSKTRPVKDILAAYAAGVRHFGESRVEEANPRMAAVAAQVAADDAPVWHMIGHIQSRKVRDVVRHEGVRRFGWVHSVHDPALAERLSRMAAEQEDAPPLDWLAQVNVSGEASKSGFQAVNWQTDAAAFGVLADALKHAATLPALRLRGLMTMAPIADDPEDVRPVFRGLRLLRDALEQRLGLPLPELSMGMTDDYPVAIEEGATMVRVGRAIFGER